MLKRLVSLTVIFAVLLTCLGITGVPVMADSADDVKVFGLFSDTHDAALTKSDGSVSKSNGGIQKVMSDIFARANVTKDNLDGLDGVIMAGDIVYMNGDGNGNMADGDETAYNTFNSIEDVQAVRTANKLVYAMGNHEIPLQSTNPEVIEECRSLFRDNIGMDPEHVRTLGGYTFIAAGAEDYVPGTYTGREVWMRAEIEKALNDGTTKPVFLVVHHPMADSTYDTPEEGFNSGVYSEEFKSFVRSQPRLIVISGHTHTPAAHPQAIRQIQNGCTFVNTSYVSGGNGAYDVYSGVYADAFSNAMMMEISNDNIVTFKRFHVNGNGGEALGEDWVLDIPAMINNEEGSYKYTDDRFSESKAPSFAADAKGTVTDITSNSALITFPDAIPADGSENNMVQYYKFSLMDMDNATVVKEEILLSDFYKPASAQSTNSTYAAKELQGNTSYRLSVTPITSFRAEGKPLDIDFTTEKNVVYIGDRIEMALDAAGTNVIDTNLERENNKSNGYGTNYGGSWAISTGYVTVRFDVPEEGVYRFTSKLASSGATGRIVITNTEDASDTKTVDANVNTGGFGVSNADFYWTDTALKKGSYTVKVSRPSGDSLRLWNVTIGKIGEISAGDIGYSIKKTVQERSDGLYLGDPTHVNGTGSALTAKQNAYITWELTPEYTGVYSIAVDFNADDDATCSLYNASYADRSDSNKMGQTTVNTGYGKENIVDFGDIAMIKGNTYTFTLYSPSTNTLASPYVKYILAAWERDIDPAETDVAVTGLWSAKKGTNITTSWAGMDSNSWISFDITFPVDAVYRATVTGGVYQGIDATLAGAGESHTVHFNKTAENNDNNLAWNTKKDFDMGTFAVKAGTYEFKLSTSNGGTMLFNKLTFVSEAAYEFVTDNITVSGADYDRCMSATQSGHIGSSGVMLAQTNYWFEYDVDAAAANYMISIYYGIYSSDATTYQPVSEATVYLDGVKLGTFPLEFANGYNSGSKWAELCAARLTEGTHTIKLTWDGGGDKGYSVGQLALDAIDTPITNIYSGKTAENLLTSLDGQDECITARCMLPGDVNNKPVTMIFALYEGDTLCKVNKTSVTGKKNSVVAVTLDDIVYTPGKKYSTKVFLIDDIGSLIPYYSVSGQITDLSVN